MEVQREEGSFWFDALLFLLISCIQQRLSKSSGCIDILISYLGGATEVSTY